MGPGGHADADLDQLGGPGGPDNDLPSMAERVRAAFADPAPEPDWTDRDAVVEYLVEGERQFAGPDSFVPAILRHTAP
jgi:hypothetical protein